MSMYEVIGANNPEYLLADPNGADLIAIPCKPGNGKINRGTVMYRGQDGMWLPATATEAVDTNSLSCWMKPLTPTPTPPSQKMHALTAPVA